MRRFALASIPRSGDGSERLALAARVVAIGVCVVASVYVISIVRFSGEDSRFPIGHALDFLHGTRSGQLYQTLFFAERINHPFAPTVRALNLVQSHVFIGAGLLVGLLLAEWRRLSDNPFGPTGQSYAEGAAT